MTDIMADIETLGKKPGCIVLSIGASTFDPYDEYESNDFYVNICPYDSMKLGFTTDPDTIKWWSKQSKESKEQLKDNRKSVYDSVKEFHTWFKDVKGEKLWCQGINFDEPIMNELFVRMDIPIPWKFWNVRDTRTVYDVCNFDARSEPRGGTYHNALDDSKHQIKCLRKALSFEGVE